MAQELEIWDIKPYQLLRYSSLNTAFKDESDVGDTGMLVTWKLDSGDMDFGDMEVVVKGYFTKMENVGDRNSVSMIESDVFVPCMTLDDLLLVLQSVRTFQIRV